MRGWKRDVHRHPFVFECVARGSRKDLGFHAAHVIQMRARDPSSDRLEELLFVERTIQGKAFVQTAEGGEDQDGVAGVGAVHEDARDGGLVIHGSARATRDGRHFTYEDVLARGPSPVGGHEVGDSAANPWSPRQGAKQGLVAS